MHGAAQTAKAPPSSARRAAPPRARRAAPGANDPLRHRQQPDEREPDDDEHEARRRRSARSRDSTLPIAAAPAPSSDEHDGEAEDERHARDRHPPRRAPLRPSRPRLDARDRREIAGDERQHARRHDRREAGDERDGEAAPTSRTARALRRAAARLSGSSRPAVSGRRLPVAVALRLQRQTPSASSAAPAMTPPIGQPPREQVEALAAAARRGSRPEVARRARPRSASRSSTASIRFEISALIRCAAGALRLVERRVARRAHDLRPRGTTATCVGCAQAAAAGAASTSAATSSREDAATITSERRPDARVELPASFGSVIGPAMCTPTSRPLRSTKYVSGTPVTAVAVADHRRSRPARSDTSRRGGSRSVRASPVTSW